MQISHLDHLVLTVNDIEATLVFYSLVLGMKEERFGEGRVALKFGNQKINLHEYGNEFEPKSHQPTPSSADLCFITQTPIEEAIAHVKQCGIEIIQGPVERTGASSQLISIYFRDPELNLIEVANELYSS